MRNLTTAEKLVVVSCVGAFSVVSDLLYLSKQRLFVLCKIGSSCWNEWIPQLIMSCARRVVCRNSDTDRFEHGRTSFQCVRQGYKSC